MSLLWSRIPFFFFSLLRLLRFISSRVFNGETNESRLFVTNNAVTMRNERQENDHEKYDTQGPRSTDNCSRFPFVRYPPSGMKRKEGKTKGSICRHRWNGVRWETNQRASDATWRDETRRDGCSSQRTREKWKLFAGMNTFGIGLREHSRARKAIAFNCELE